MAPTASPMAITAPLPWALELLPQQGQGYGMPASLPASCLSQLSTSSALSRALSLSLSLCVLVLVPWKSVLNSLLYTLPPKGPPLSPHPKYSQLESPP